VAKIGAGRGMSFASFRRFWAIEQRRRHLWIADYARPFAEGEVGGNDDRGPLIETADQVEQQLPAGLGAGEIAEFVEDDEVEAGEIIGKSSLATGAGLGLELIDEIDGGVESPS
jgi:hypothetical protein